MIEHQNVEGEKTISPEREREEGKYRSQNPERRTVKGERKPPNSEPERGVSRYL